MTDERWAYLKRSAAAIGGEVVRELVSEVDRLRAESRVRVEVDESARRRWPGAVEQVERWARRFPGPLGVRVEYRGGTALGPEGHPGYPPRPLSVRISSRAGDGRPVHAEFGVSDSLLDHEEDLGGFLRHVLRMAMMNLLVSATDG